MKDQAAAWARCQALSRTQQMPANLRATATRATLRPARLRMHVRPRQRRRMEEVGPLEAAMFEFEARNFQRAQQWLDTFLATHPEHPEALLLMAHLHDLWAWNKPETASRYYRRLAAIEDNPRAACTGLCGELALRYALGQWERVIATGEEIQRRFPGLDWDPQGTPAVAWALQHARKHLRRKGGADQQAERSANEVGEPESN